MYRYIISVGFITALFYLTACSSSESNTTKSARFPLIHKVQGEITINGSADDLAWSKAEWQFIDHVWLGEPMQEGDFKGRFKLLWSTDRIYLLAETTDDVILDTHVDGLDRYWDDDCLEIFIDENNSGGNHQYNHQAFAYHIAQNLRVTDMGVDSLPAYFDHHLQSAKVIDGNLTTWELALEVHTDDYIFGNKSRKLSAGEEIGFMVAYCDNDASAERENFIGSIDIPGEDKNRGWIDAGVFNKWTLAE